MMNRRRVLALLPLARAMAVAKYAPVLAGQVYVWTQHVRERKITLAETLEEMMATFAQAGYRELELTSEFVSGELRARTIELARKYKIRIPIVYSGQVMHEEAKVDASLAAILDVAKNARQAGASWINTNPSPKPQRALKSAAELATQAKALNRLAAELERMNLRLMVHQHDPEMMENAREWRHIKDHTDPSKVLFCLDTHWVYRGGQDPYRLVEEAGPRLKSLHLRNSRQGVWSESLEDGDIDYRRVAAFLKERRYDGYLVVELAYEQGMVRTRPLGENLARSLAYAKKVFA